MIIEVNPHSLAEISANYTKAIDWLTSVGYEINQSRIGLYKKALNSLLESFSKDGWGDLQDLEYRQHLTTVFVEVRELVSIYLGLSKRVSVNNSYSESLKHFLKGPFHATDESMKSASNRARNIGFELYINSLFSEAGFDLKLGSKSDMKFTFKGFTFYVECKRPQYYHQVNSRVKSATEQLYVRYQEGDSTSSRGIIALEVSKLFNPNNYILSVRNENDLLPLMYSEVKNFITKYNSIWNKKKDKRTITLFLAYRYLANIRDSSQLVTVRWIGSVILCKDISGSDMKIIEEINSKFGNVIQKIC